MPIFSGVAFILANVTRVAGNIFPIRLQLGFRRALFLIVAKVAHVGPAFAFILANIAAIVADVARVAPNITAILIFEFVPCSLLQRFRFASEEAGGE